MDVGRWSPLDLLYSGLGRRNEQKVPRLYGYMEVRSYLDAFFLERYFQIKIFFKVCIKQKK